MYVCVFICIYIHIKKEILRNSGQVRKVDTSKFINLTTFLYISNNQLVKLIYRRYHVK